MPLSIQPENLKRGSEVGEDVGSPAEAILTRIVALKSWTICFIINRATEAGRVAGRLYGTRPETECGASKRKQCRQGCDHSGWPDRTTATSTSTYAVSPWIASSRPSSSCASSTRTGVMRSMIQSIPSVKISAQTDENSPAASCFRKKLGSPASNPFTPPLAVGFHAVEANTPSRIIPRKPPTPCTPHTSSASSHRNRFFSAQAECCADRDPRLCVCRRRERTRARLCPRCCVRRSRLQNLSRPTAPAYRRPTPCGQKENKPRSARLSETACRP